MIIVADSGGSKIDWRFLYADGTIGQANSAGFNPYYQPADDLRKSITSILPSIEQNKGATQNVFFYGAGVSSEKNQLTVKNTFTEFFPNASVEIGWDLLAAARALCNREPGIACILGTGSNSCLYDGGKITGNIANLGWILADEGSGADIGKHFLIDYLREKMPQSLADQFKARFPFSREEFLEKIYQQERPSAFLGSFTKFIFQHLKEQYCYKLVYERFSVFYENNVMKYPDYQKLKVHFTGSVAFYFSNILRQVANDKGITVKNILEGPIAGLTLYHANKTGN
ncbi:MAG TPA: N-acetylglucosamine kinase [Chryseosolibacter sp.]|nr:N-acetylglucosamine kinase [Chryseosolibacter sp.]